MQKCNTLISRGFNGCVTVCKTAIRGFDSLLRLHAENQRVEQELDVAYQRQ